MTSLFRFDDVVVSFGDEVVIDHLDLDIADGGAVTCLVGPSGAGKSTLLRLCNRLEVPTAGTVSFRGDSIGGLDPLTLRRRVGMVFQRPTLFEGTVRENLAVADPDGSDERFGDALERCGLDRAFLDAKGDRLSGGEAQRACLARTLVTEPEVLLLDEPTSALDPAATRALEKLACSLAADGLPMLWVTHDIAQAGRIARDVVVLVDGRVATDDERAAYLASGEEQP